MKSRIALSLAAAAVLTQAGCTTTIKSLPVPAALNTQKGQDVALYFGEQPHASVKQSFGTKEIAVRVPRSPDISLEANCNNALTKAVQELRDYARTQHANAVVEIKTRFQRNEAVSSTEFKCGASLNASTLAIRGDVVQLDTP
jgi:glutamate 5-kinase